VDRDHASVMHGLKLYDNLMATDARFRNKARLVEQYVIGGEITQSDPRISYYELLSEIKCSKYK
jgi:hypothetical protein